MSLNRIVTRRFGAALVVAVVVLVPALGCGSDDDDSAATEAATGATDTGTRTLGEGIENLQEAQAQLCPELSDLSADLDGGFHQRDRGRPGRPCQHRIHCGSSRRQRRGADPGRGRGRGGRRRRPLVQPGVAGRVRRGGRPGAAGEASDGVQQLSDALQCQ